MKVLSTSATRLVIEERPILLAALFLIFVIALAAAALSAMLSGRWVMAGLMGLGSAAFWAGARYFVERVRLVLDRETDTVMLRRVSLRGARNESYPLSTLSGVELQSRLGDDGHTYRLALRFAGKDQPVPMTRYYQSGIGTRICVDTAEAWLRGSQIAGERAR